MTSPVILLEQIKNQAEAYIKNTFSGIAQKEELEQLNQNHKELEKKLADNSERNKENIKLIFQKLELEKENKKLENNESAEKTIAKLTAKLNLANTENRELKKELKLATRSHQTSEGLISEQKRTLRTLVPQTAQKPNNEAREPILKPARQRLKGQKLKDLYQQVVKRDNGQCQICKGQGQQAHHILYGSKKEDVLDNLLLVCGSCHLKVHAHLLAIEPYLSQSQIAYMADKNEQNYVREVV